MESSDDESPLHKVDTKLTPFRVRNDDHSKRRRRSSIASIAMLQDEVEGPGDHRWAYRGKSARDRFVAHASSWNIPLTATPRSRRLANILGEAGDRRLYFNATENVDPAASSRIVIPFRKELQRLTRSLYEIPAPPSTTSASTNLGSVPETCLGAPNLRDDFYSRLAAWSEKDLLAVAMNSSVVYRNMQSHTISRVVSLHPIDCVTCIRWNSSSSILGVGLDCGSMRVYDPETHVCIREYKSRRESDFVGDFSWRDTNIFTVGHQSGHLRQFDVREARGGKTIRSHKSRICGVEWNPEGRFLATGGGDGVVICWDSRTDRAAPLTTVHGYDLAPPSSSDAEFSSSPVIGRVANAITNDSSTYDLDTLSCRWRMRRHLSTVKAFAWCPWSPGTLASGGGTKDGTIRFWDVVQGRVRRNVIQTHSQITSLHFSRTCRELVSTHGYAFAPVNVSVDGVLPAPRRHSILVHNYPRGDMVGKIFDAMHGRITHSCLSPDGTRLVTCGSDDSIRIYKIFGKQDPVPRDLGSGMQTIIR